MVSGAGPPRIQGYSLSTHYFYKENQVYIIIYMYLYLKNKKYNIIPDYSHLAHLPSLKMGRTAKKTSVMLWIRRPMYRTPTLPACCRSAPPVPRRASLPPPRAPRRPLPCTRLAPCPNSRGAVSTSASFPAPSLSSRSPPPRPSLRLIAPTAAMTFPRPPPRLPRASRAACCAGSRARRHGSALAAVWAQAPGRGPAPAVGGAPSGSHGVHVGEVTEEEQRLSQRSTGR
jgi:hypothetical protein